MDYEKQIENDAEEIINGKGYVVIPNVFTKEEIKEAKDLIDKNMDMLLEEAGKKSAIQGEYDDKKDSANLVQGKIIVWNLVFCAGVSIVIILVLFSFRSFFIASLKPGPLPP